MWGNNSDNISDLGLSVGSRALKGAYRAAGAAYRTAKAEAERYIEHPNGCISTKSAWSIYALRRSICASVPAALDIPFRVFPETDRYAPFGCEKKTNFTFLYIIPKNFFSIPPEIFKITLYISTHLCYNL